MHVCAPWACSALGSHKRALDHLGLELQMVESHQWVLEAKLRAAWVFNKINKYSNPLSSLSASDIVLLSVIFVSECWGYVGFVETRIS